MPSNPILLGCDLANISDFTITTSLATFIAGLSTAAINVHHRQQVDGFTNRINHLNLLLIE